jgi:hypothetical protein
MVAGATLAAANGGVEEFQLAHDGEDGNAADGHRLATGCCRELENEMGAWQKKRYCDH